MNYKNIDELKKLTKKIGLWTLEDLQLFQKLQNCNGWDIITALKNYLKELDQNI